MYATFKGSFNLTKTCKKNHFIYFLKNLPLIGDLISRKAYSSKVIITLSNIYTYLSEFLGIFFWKFVYTVIVALGCYGVVDKNKALFQDKYVHVLIFFSIIGGLFNNSICEVKEDTYFGIFLLRLDAKKYQISNFIYNTGKYFIGMLTANLVILGIIFKIPVYICILVPIYATLMKVITGAWFISFNNKNIYNYKRLSKYQGINLAGAIVLFLLAAEGFVFFALPGISIIIVSVISLVLSVFCFIYLIKFDNYKLVYKIVLKEGIDNTNENMNTTDAKNMQSVLTQKGKDGKIKVVEAESNKEGYAYFHDIFVQRHRKILFRPVLFASLVAIAAYVTLGILMVMTPDSFNGFNKQIEKHLPIFLFVMYFANRGEAMTKAMFFNCDRAMLNFRFYRKPKDLLALFILRLKTILMYNMVLTLVLSSGLLVLYKLSGGTENITNYFIIFISMMSMGVFFSIHYIFLYYIFQPYTTELGQKIGPYGVITYATYMVCYMIAGEDIPLYIFSLIMIGLSIVYFVVAMFIVYKKAPKSFKLRR